MGFVQTDVEIFGLLHFLAGKTGSSWYGGALDVVGDGRVLQRVPAVELLPDGVTILLSEIAITPNAC